MTDFPRDEAFMWKCLVDQGFNLSASNPGAVGYVLSLKVNGEAMSTDFTVKYPPEGKEKKVVGVMDSVFWLKDKQRPMKFVFFVGGNTKGKLESLLNSDLDKATVEIEYAVFRFDKNAKPNTYYKALGTKDGSPAEANIMSETIYGSLRYNLKVATETSTWVKTPEHFEVELDLEAAKDHSLEIAASNTLKNAIAWGMAPAA